MGCPWSSCCDVDADREDGLDSAMDQANIRRRYQRRRRRSGEGQNLLDDSTDEHPANVPSTSGTGESNAKKNAPPSDAASSSGYRRYDGYRVLRVVPKTKENLDLLRSLKDHKLFATVCYWRDPAGINSEADLMVGPGEFDRACEYLTKNGMEPRILIKNLQTLISEQKAMIQKAELFHSGDDPAKFTVNEFHSADEINAWMTSLAKKHADIVNLHPIGLTSKGKEMIVIKIGSMDLNKPGIWIDGGIHAREWISVSTAVYIINELVTNRKKYEAILDRIDFFILPIVNPDGYEFTRQTENGGDRLWRKTRSGPHFGRPGSPWHDIQGIGVDANRNFDCHWGAAGSNHNPTSEVYCGPSALSEIECANIIGFIQKRVGIIKAFVTLHCYGDLLIYPYGFAPALYPPDVNDLQTLAKEIIAAIHRVHQTQFVMGSVWDLLSYMAPGGSMDWAKDVAGIKWTYALELRPGKGDSERNEFYGYLLPSDFIIPVGSEIWAGLLVIAEKIISDL